MSVDAPCIALVFEVNARPRIIVTADTATRERIINELSIPMYAALIEAMRGVDVDDLHTLRARDTWRTQLAAECE